MGATDRAFEAFEHMGQDQMGAPLWAGVLPFPISTNHTWGTRGKARFLTAEALAFRDEVDKLPKPRSPLAGPVRARIDLYPPDMRIRDGDNFAGKSLLDALVTAGIIEDDSNRVLVQCIWTWRGVDKLRPRCCVEVWGFGQ